MSDEPEDGARRGRRARFWLRSGPLAALVLVSFFSAHHTYVTHTSAAQHTASLLALVIWTVLLTLHAANRDERVKRDKSASVEG